MNKVALATSIALLLASCGNGPGTPGNGNTGGDNGSGNPGGSGITSLSGKVYKVSNDSSGVSKGVVWTAGQKTVSLEVPTSYQPYATKVISTGTISAAGELNIALPDTNIPTMPITQYQPVDPGDAQSPYTTQCNGNFTPGNTAIKTVTGTLKVEGNGILTGLKDANTLSNLFPQGMTRSTSLVYADGATSWSGSMTCKTIEKATQKEFMTITINMNAQLVKGWNVMYGESTMSADMKTMTSTMTTLAASPQTWVATGNY